MGLYDHYTNVDPGSITSATSSLRTKLNTARAKLSTFKSSLTDDIWKASAKSTLTTACDKLDSEIYEQLLAKLDNADTIASEITKYNTAKSAAQTYQSYLNNANSNTSASDKSSWSQGVSSNESIMQECINNIDSLQ